MDALIPIVPAHDAARKAAAASPWRRGPRHESQPIVTVIDPLVPAAITGDAA